MLISKEIKELALEIEAGGAQAPDALVRSFVTKLDAACQQPENEQRNVLYQNSPAVLEPYPLDKDGYAVSFDPLTQEKEFLEAWHRYGIVVGKGILSPQQCSDAIEGITERFNALSNGTCELSKPGTWQNMPKDDNGTPFLSRGFLELYHDDVLAQMRQNVRLYLHQALLWN
jgi:hypothetical protein